MIEQVQQGADPLLEALRVSGPAGGLTIILGFLIRNWLTSMSTVIAEIKTKVGALEVQANAAKLEAVTAVATLRARVDEHSRRINTIEGK